MKFSSTLPLCCVVASFSIALAGPARADQESYVDVTSTNEPTYNGVFGGLASCEGVPAQDCSVATDQIAYNLWANWSAGSAKVEASGVRWQVSPGDSAFIEIALYCSNGNGGVVFGSSPDDTPTGDGELPPVLVDSYCPAGTIATEAAFTYGVEATDGS